MMTVSLGQYGPPAHARSVENVASEFKTNIETGLSSSEVEERREVYGENIFEKRSGWSILHSLSTQFSSPLVLLLVFAAVATYLLGHTVDTIVIALALAINVIIGVLQEGRASQAFEKLSSSQRHFATVLRDGNKVQVDTRDLVPGDIVILEPGGWVPADLRLVSTNDLQVDEAALTGESLSVAKSPEVVEKDIPVTERGNMAWMGTVITGGVGKGVVVSIGGHTEMGKIAEELGGKDTVVTPIQRNVARLAHFISAIAVGAIVLITALGLIRGEDLVEMLTVAIAIAVSAVPEGLPAAVAVVLAVGMERLLARGGLVKNLQAAETLGSTTVILTDKTGTLTQAKMHVGDLVPASRIVGSEASGEHDLLRFAILASDAYLETVEGEERIQGRPVERAILGAALERGLHDDAASIGERRIDYSVFSSDRKYAASLSHIGEERYLVLTGAPEVLLDLSSSVYVDGEDVELSDEYREKIIREQKERSGNGERLIAVARVKTDAEHVALDEEGRVSEDTLSNLAFLGIISLEDPVREGVAEEVKRARGASVRVVMVTGDNPETAGHVAEVVGISGTRVVHGREFEKFSDEEVKEAVYDGAIFARVTPAHKLRISKVLRKAGEVVAMTGDGVNDAPALKSADIGIAVGSGTEVAKEASDLILLDDSFAVIVAAIEEGRRIGDNLKRIVTHLIATSFGGIILIAGALLFAMPLPILPVQILWLNIIEEGFLNFPFAFEPAASGVMKRNPREAGSREFLTKKIKKLMITSGALTGVFTTTLFVTLYSMGTDLDVLRTLMFVALSFDALFFTLSLKDFEAPIWRIDFSTNVWLILAFCASVALLIGALVLPPLSGLLSLVALEGWHYALLGGVALFNLGVIEATKYRLFIAPLRAGN
ncbi:MAG: HAD-IC family P-type ATPase [Candidatus Paceibacterota bacterium]